MKKLSRDSCSTKPGSAVRIVNMDNFEQQHIQHQGPCSQSLNSGLHQKGRGALSFGRILAAAPKRPFKMFEDMNSAGWDDQKGTETALDRVYNELWSQW